MFIFPHHTQSNLCTTCILWIIYDWINWLSINYLLCCKSFKALLFYLSSENMKVSWRYFKFGCSGLRNFKTYLGDYCGNNFCNQLLKCVSNKKNWIQITNTSGIFINLFGHSEYQLKWAKLYTALFQRFHMNRQCFLLLFVKYKFVEDKGDYDTLNLGFSSPKPEQIDFYCFNQGSSLHDFAMATKWN